MDRLLLFWTCIYGYYGEITADVSPFSICLVNFHALDKRISENSYFLKIRKFSQFADGCRSQPSVFPLRICRIFLLLPGFDWGLLWYVWVNYSKILRNHNVWSQTAEPCSGFFLLRSFAPEYFICFWGKHECIVIFRVILRLPCARVYIWST